MSKSTEQLQTSRSGLLRHWFALGRNFTVIRHSLNGITGYASIRLTTSGEGVGWAPCRCKECAWQKCPSKRNNC